jgi:hypothetical protein
MSTAFRYIVREHLSHKYEDVATDTLDFILRSSESARNSFTRFVRAIEPNLPKNLHFRTQASKDRTRPDNLLHLIDLCDAVGQSFDPMRSKQIKDKKIPGLILQLNSILDQALNEAEKKGIISRKSAKGNLGKTSYPDSIGRYIQFLDAKPGAWIGTEFSLWKLKGETPFWLVFEDTEWQRGREVRDKLEVWAKGRKIPENWWRNGYGYDEFAIGIRLETDKDEADVISSVVNQLKVIATKLASISRRGK